MNVLVISNTLPFPLHDGSKLTLFNLLKHLTFRHDVDLIAFLENKDSEKYLEKISSYCNNLSTVLTRQQQSFLSKTLYHLSTTPYNVAKRYSKHMEELTRSKIAKRKYDIIHFYGFEMLPYGLRLQDIPKVAYVIDAVSLYFRRNFVTEKRLSKKFSYFIEFVKMRRYERNNYGKFERCVVVSETDKIALQQSCPDARIGVIPNGVDTEYFMPTHAKEVSPSLLFSGNMDFPPNVHAVLWFVNKVLPKVREIFPDVKFYIVGRNPSSEIDHLKYDKHIIVTGFVKDIRPYFDQATIYVCPMVSGTGIKNKLLEAMAMGKPIVASSLSIQGISDAEDTNCLLTANTVSEFSDRITDLLNSSIYRQELGLQARKFVLNNYSWKKSADLLEKIYWEAIREFKN